MNNILSLFRFIPPYVSPGTLAPNKMYSVVKLPKMKRGSKLVFRLILQEEPSSVEGFLKVSYGDWIDGVNLSFKYNCSTKMWASKLSDIIDVKSFFTIQKDNLVLVAKKPVSLQIYEMKDSSWI